MKKYGQKNKLTKVEFIDDKTDIASTTLKSPASGDDDSVYQITYMVKTDAGSCSRLGPQQLEWHKKWWNHLGASC